jgi:DAACS family dicarboxylate/amino acid:cation (Na+ or H+) symporter
MVSQKKLAVGIVLGAGAGLLLKAVAPGSRWLELLVAHVAAPLGQIFLRLLFMLVVPLLFSALVTGLCGLDLKQLGRIGLRLLVYTVAISAVAVAIGMGLVNALKPGAGMAGDVRALLAQNGAVAAAPAQSPALASGGDGSAIQVFVSMIPDNPLKAMANGDMLGLIIFSLLFGIALVRTETPAALRLRELIEGLYDTMMTLIEGVLKLAPLGVGALLFCTTARLGVEALAKTAAYVGVVLLALTVHMFVVYSASVYFFGGRNPIQFFKDVRLAAVTAFSTASSSATLPTALKVSDENLKLPPSVGRFVLTAGSAMNQNGTALFEGVTVLFLAQVFNVPLSFGQQLTVMGICILGGIGTAGIPAGSLPVIAMILGMFHIPPEGLGLILGVDRLLDMCRTTLNVVGDLAAAVFVARDEEGRPQSSQAPVEAAVRASS